MFSEKCDIRQRSTCRTEPCGCLDIVRSAFRDTFAKTDFFFFRQVAGFHDHFQDFIFCYFFQDGDFFGNQIIIFIFHRADVNNHVDFISTVIKGMNRFCRFRFDVPVAQGKSDYRTDGKAGIIFTDFFHIARRHTDGRGTVLHCLIA